MKGSLESKLQRYPRPYLTDMELFTVLDGTPDSRYSKVKRLLAQGKLLHVRRGLYCITEQAGQLIKPHRYELAQFVYGPSYISLESAMSFHQLIPEAVYTCTSATSKRSREFQITLGVFSYQHLPMENFFTGVELIKENGYQFLMAKPWKAICDYVFCYKKDWDSFEPLLESLRIDYDALPKLRTAEAACLEAYYHQRRISRFLKGIQEESNQGDIMKRGHNT